MLPHFVRASVYDGLLWVGSHIYGLSLSRTVYKLPFDLYLRRGSPALAPKYRVEAHTLDMVEQLTRIPAPRADDVFDLSLFILAHDLRSRTPDWSGARRYGR